MTTIRYELMYKGRAWFPDTIYTVATLDRLVLEHSTSLLNFRVEVMTDQVDVYAERSEPGRSAKRTRRVATYMAM